MEPKPEEPIPTKEQPAVIEQQIAQVEQGAHRFTVQEIQNGEHRFKPSRGLPVWINYQEPRDPFELYETVTYTNGPINVVMPRGFKCDATSTPWFVFLTPSVFHAAGVLCWAMSWSPIAMITLWVIGTFLGILLPWVMPGVGQLGLHARAAFVHDALCRTQLVARVVADAVMWEIMEYDKVRFVPRWAIYMLLRMFGSRAWKNNAAMIAAAKAAVRAGEPIQSERVEPTSVIAPAVVVSPQGEPQ